MTLRRDAATDGATDSTISITFIGNATVLIRYAGVTILPGALTIALPRVMGSLLEFSSRGASTGREERADLRLYVTGDTIVYEGLREIPERHREIDIALLHLGGTRVMGLTVTMDADQGVELLRTVKPRLAMPIHYDDYEAFKSPLQDFVTAVEEAGLASSVAYLERGQPMTLPTPVPTVTG
jgi:L-ascorbate metabolism protein UlaG (beta-lactamase superfamily)